MRWIWLFTTKDQLEGQLPARKLNLTELRVFAEAMAKAVGGRYSVRTGLGQDPPEGREIQWEQLEGLLPDELVATSIVATRAVAPTDWYTDLYIQLRLITPPDLPMVIGTSDDGSVRRELTELWSRLGRPARRGWWLYPAAFLGILVLALTGAIVLWVRGDLSLWLVPLVALVLWTAYTVGVRTVEVKVIGYRQPGGPLPINFRLLEKVRRDRAETRVKWTDRIVALLTGVGITLLGALVKEVLER